MRSLPDVSISNFPNVLLCQEHPRTRRTSANSSRYPESELCSHARSHNISAAHVRPHCYARDLFAPLALLLCNGFFVIVLITPFFVILVVPFFLSGGRFTVSVTSPESISSPGSVHFFQRMMTSFLRFGLLRKQPGHFLFKIATFLFSSSPFLSRFVHAPPPLS